ncbi:MAG TPA: hypothetical protein VFS20_07585 [Longimicrobium sp.]|nr:hypothetical protein [Longimicrobium sp.]
MKILKWAAAAALLCAAIALPAEAQSARQEQRPRQERNRIRADEIAQSNASTVYQLIQARRGMWLMRNQPTSLGEDPGAGKMLVFLDGAQLDGVEDLRQIATTGVRMVEFLNPGETEHKLGRYSVVGAIRVVTRESSPQEDSARAAHN